MKRIITLLSIALILCALSPTNSAAEKDDYVILTTPKWEKKIEIGLMYGMQAAAYKGKVYTHDTSTRKNMIRWSTKDETGLITPEPDNNGSAIAFDDAGNLACINGGKLDGNPSVAIPTTGVHIYQPDGNLVKIGFSTEEINAIKSCLYTDICYIISATGDLCGEDGGTIRLMGSKIFEIHIGKDRKTGKIITTGYSIYSPSGHNLPDYNYFQNGYIKVISDTEWLVQGCNQTTSPTTGIVKTERYLSKYNPIEDVMTPYAPKGSTTRRTKVGIDRFTLRGHQLLLNDGVANRNPAYDTAPFEIALYDESFSNNKIFSTIVLEYTGLESNYDNKEANWLFSNKISDDEYEIHQFTYYVSSEKTSEEMRFKTIRTFSVKAVHTDIACPAPKAFTITADTKYDATKGKNIFSGFKASWIAPTDALLPFKEYILYYVEDNKNIEFARTTSTETTLYGMQNACKIRIEAVYINGNQTKTSAIAEADFNPTKIVSPVVVKVPPSRLIRYTTDGMYKAMLTWDAPATYPVASYKIAYADATAGAPDEASYVVKESSWNGDWTGIDQLIIDNASKLADNPTGVKINYIVYPGFNIGNTFKTSITDADYSDAGIAEIKYPTFAEVSADDVRGDATFTVDMIQTGVEDVVTSKVAVYPNPTEGVINITAPSAIGEIALYNISGSLVAKFNSNGESTLSIDISEISAGTYFLKTGTQVAKIIKK